MNIENLNSKQEFRRYLERSGVVDSLSKVLIGLYEEPEKPLNAMEYMVSSFSSGPSNVEVEDLNLLIKELEEKCQDMLQKNLTLKEKISEYIGETERTVEICDQ